MNNRNTILISGLTLIIGIAVRRLTANLANDRTDLPKNNRRRN